MPGSAVNVKEGKNQFKYKDLAQESTKGCNLIVGRRPPLLQTGLACRQVSLSAVTIERPFSVNAVTLSSGCDWTRLWSSR